MVAGPSPARLHGFSSQDTLPLHSPPHKDFSPGGVFFFFFLAGCVLVKQVYVNWRLLSVSEYKKGVEMKCSV